MPARLVTIAVTISVTIAVTMMFGHSMSYARYVFSRYKYFAHAYPAVTFGRGDKSYSAHCCLRRRGKPVLKPICQAPRKLFGAPGELIWPAKSFPVGLEVIWSASCRCLERWEVSGKRCRERQKGCLERQDGCLERREGCLEGQEGLSGRPGARLAVLQAAESAWKTVWNTWKSENVGRSAWKTVWSAWRSENVGRSDVLEFPLQEAPRGPKRPQEAPRGPEGTENRKRKIEVDNIYCL